MLRDDIRREELTFYRISTRIYKNNREIKTRIFFANRGYARDAVRPGVGAFGGENVAVAGRKDRQGSEKGA